MHKVTLPLAIVEEARIGKADGYGFKMNWNLPSSQNESAILVPVLNFKCRSLTWRRKLSKQDVTHDNLPA